MPFFSQKLQELGTSHEKTIGSKGKDLWGIPGAQLPAAIQRVFNDLVEGGKPPGGRTYALAVGIVKNWAHGKGAKDPKVIAEAQKAIAEWEELRAKAHARSAARKGKALAEDALVGRIAEAWVSEDWSPQARAAALEARRKKRHDVFAGAAKELRKMSKATTDKYASEHSAADAAEKLAVAMGPKGNSKFDAPAHGRKLAKNLRQITWGPNASRMTELGNKIDGALDEDYDEHIEPLRSDLRQSTHYSPEGLAQARDMGKELRDQHDAPNITVKIPSGSEVALTHRQAQHLKSGRSKKR